MARSAQALRALRALAAGFLLLTLLACSREPTPTAKSFEGKWKSSKMVTPLYMHPNGEWEIKKDDQRVLQYGIWQYRDNAIAWTFKLNGEVFSEVNAVVATGATGFKLRETDGSISTFSKLD